MLLTGALIGVAVTVITFTAFVATAIWRRMKNGSKK